MYAKDLTDRKKERKKEGEKEVGRKGRKKEKTLTSY